MCMALKGEVRIIRDFAGRCPDCCNVLLSDSMKCSNCSWQITNEDGVYNLLPSTLGKEKVNEELIHKEVHAPVCWDLLYKKSPILKDSKKCG